MTVSRSYTFRDRVTLSDHFPTHLKKTAFPPPFRRSGGFFFLSCLHVATMCLLPRSVRLSFDRVGKPLCLSFCSVKNSSTHRPGAHDQLHRYFRTVFRRRCRARKHPRQPRRRAAPALAAVTTCPLPRRAGGSYPDLAAWLRSEKRVVVSHTTVLRFLKQCGELADG